VREADALERGEGLADVPREEVERLRAAVEPVVDTVAEVVDRVVAAEQQPPVGGQAVVVEAVAAVGDPLPVLPAQRAAPVGAQRLGHEDVVVDRRDEPPDRLRGRPVGPGGEQDPLGLDRAAGRAQRRS
jgi:hypothetical protein